MKEDAHDTHIPDNSVEDSISDNVKVIVESDIDDSNFKPTENRTKISTTKTETSEQSASTKPDKSSKEKLKINKFKILGPTLPSQWTAKSKSKSKKPKASDYADMEDDPDFQVWT